MEDQQGRSVPKKISELTYATSCKNACKVASMPKTLTQESLSHIAAKDCAVRGVTADVALFLVKVAALETTRRFSRAKCPFAWRSLQAFQMLCYPPFKWIQSWAPFKGLVRGMQILSRPLLVLSIATAFSEKSDKPRASDDRNISHVCADLDEESSSLQPCVVTRDNIEFPNCDSSENWLLKLYEELDRLGIRLPERINKNELQRFNSAANGDFSRLLSSVKKTIRWRETYNIFSEEELKMWADVVFWHGYDVRHRPCLIVRLGLACTSLPTHDRPRFAQAVVSQMEHGILHLADRENPQIVVLVDCEGLSPFRVPMQMLRSCSLLFQDHFPNCLGGLYVIRLPPVVRMMVQTFLKFLKPATRQKLKFLGEKYQEVLSEYFETLPSCLGGKCTCPKCSRVSFHDTRRLPSTEVESDAQLMVEGSMRENPSHGSLASEIDIRHDFDQAMRSGMVGILILCVFIAFLAGIFDPETRPNLFP